MTVIEGDCLLVMPTLDADSFDAIVTDPPYGLGFMGVKWDTYGDGKGRAPSGKHTFDQVGGNSHARKPGGVELIRGKENRKFQEKATEWFVGMLRVAKPGAHLVAFGGTRTYHRLTCAIEDAGWEIRDCLSWLYGSGFPKSRNGPWGGTALKPGWEPIVLARKPLVGTVAANHAKHGIGALNINGCRIGLMTPEEIARSGASTGGYQGGLRPVSWKDDEREPQGRWPANVVLDEDAAGMLDEQSGRLQSGTAVGGLNRRSNTDANCYGHFAGERTLGDVTYGDSGGASRFFYTAKASRSERDAGLENFASVRRSDGREKDIENACQRTNQRTNHHPTVKPLDLMQWLCRLVTPKGGLILDPFTGSGTTGRAAVAEGFRFIGIEKEPEYAAIARARITEYAPLFTDGAA